MDCHNAVWLTGASGPFWHEHPGDRDKPQYDGITTLVSKEGARPFLLVPII
jgi:hypothetical protein